MTDICLTQCTMNQSETTCVIQQFITMKFCSWISCVMFHRKLLLFLHRNFQNQELFQQETQTSQKVKILSNVLIRMRMIPNKLNLSTHIPCSMLIVHDLCSYNFSWI